MPIISPEDFLGVDDVPETGLLSKITNKVKRLFDFFEHYDKFTNIDEEKRKIIEANMNIMDAPLDLDLLKFK